ncbi:hypothetical protein ACX80D_08375 [Arthrobacter sp. Sr24]
MRSKIAIILAVLGLLVLGTGIGQRTIWLPPATVTASAPADLAAAPLTVIGPELLKTRDGKFTLTIKGDGPMQLAVAREDDILGWIGDAAYTRIGAADEEFTGLAATSTAGEPTVPNPAGSDMWVSEEKATDELSYTWQAPGHGDWALLFSVDGKAAAPTDISVTVDNEAGTPWAVPLMIIGSALLALAALLFLLSPSKSKGVPAAVVGRRSAGRGPTDPATGALEVEKIVASRGAGRRASTTEAPSTIAETQKAETRKSESSAVDASGDAKLAAGTGAEGESGAKNGLAGSPRPTVPSDATSALPALLLNKPSTPAESGADATIEKVSPEQVQADQPGQNHAATPEVIAEGSDSESAPTSEAATGSDPDAGGASSKDQDQDKDQDSGGGTSGKKPSSRKPRTRNKGGAKGSLLGEKTKADNGSTEKASGDSAGKDKSEFSASEIQRGPVYKTLKPTRWGAALAAVLVAGSLSPAVAADPAAPEPSATATAETTATPSTPGFPGLLDAQVQRIATAVAAAVAAGDNAKDSKELEARVGGMALEARAANYKIRAKVSSQAAMEPVNAAPLLAKVVTTTATWPRSAMMVTKGENNALPQLLTLVQASPRENYKMIQATPLLPAQTFPKVDKEGTKEIALDSSDGLKMSPADAIAALSDRLTKSDSKFKDSFNDNVYIQSVLDTQSTIVENAQDATHVFSHKANSEAAVNLRTADGGVMVVVGYTFGITGTSKEDATLTVGDDAAVFTGGKETTKGYTLNYAEPVVMYIPPADGDAKITILSATRNLVGGSFTP